MQRSAAEGVMVCKLADTVRIRRVSDKNVLRPVRDKVSIASLPM
jgi:hypothetical protein